MSVLVLPANEALAVPSRTRPIANDVYQVTNVPEPAVGFDPVAYIGKSIVVDPVLMLVDQPYKVTYRNEPAIAIKDSDGRIAFYRIPK